jgi:hypothetical protein
MNIVIGDLHGRDKWKAIDPSKYDKIVFVGDYVDSFYHTNFDILDNLKNIIQFKRDNFDKVILLLGNHDIQYMFYSPRMEFGCSGFRPEAQPDLTTLFNENKDCFQAAFQINKTIITHAGISTGWFYENSKIIDNISKQFGTTNLADTFNHMLWLKENSILHQVGRKRGGYYPHGGITWADRSETKDSSLAGYHQIVGHTPIDQITLFGDSASSTTIRYIDVLDKVTEFYEFTI